MTTALVVQKKVCYGTPEFMFFRRDLDKMMSERNRLKWGSRERYEINKDRVDFLHNTICALALLVYFAPKKRVANLPQQNYVAPPTTIRQDRKENERKKKVKAPRRIFDENQKILFSQ